MLNLLPNEIKYEKILLVSYSSLKDKVDFISKMTKYRNIFRDNFGNTSKTTLNSTANYLSQYSAPNKNGIMYAIKYDDVLVGQYALKAYPLNYILLDNAVRYNSSGPKNLFSVVSMLLINNCKILDNSVNIFTAVKKNNKNAEMIHNSYGNYELMENTFYEKFNFSNDLILKELISFKESN